jgi:hypothetical protein
MRAPVKKRENAVKKQQPPIATIGISHIDSANPVDSVDQERLFNLARVRAQKKDALPETSRTSFDFLSGS